METKTREQLVKSILRDINYDTDMDQVFRLHFNNGQWKDGYILDFDDESGMTPDTEPRFIFRSKLTGKVTEEYVEDLRSTSIPRYAK